ncbi:MAG: hypothetical protein HPY44_12685 [Armatimonadetes bacterium]|nr:hypothetical protein [Armatimonadota bacterium]
MDASLTAREDQDGGLCGTIIVARFGEQSSLHGKPDPALTSDELLMLDRALRLDDVRAYVLAANRLREREELSGR